MFRSISKKQKNEGFTLIEILVVIGIIAVIAAIVLIAINPARQFAQARNSQRDSNVNAILNAVGQYIADKQGEVPAGVPVMGADAVEIPTALCTALVPTYLPSMPTDPQSGSDGASLSATECTDLNTAGNIRYFIERDSQADGGRITVKAPDAELDRTIEVTR